MKESSGNPRRDDKKAKIQGRSYEITEIPWGGGDKKAKIQGRILCTPRQRSSAQSLKILGVVA